MEKTLNKLQIASQNRPRSGPLPRPPNIGPGGLDPSHDVGYGVERSKHHDSIISFAASVLRHRLRVGSRKQDLARRTRAGKGIGQHSGASAARHRKVGCKPC